jgi:hypothetical protein
VLTRPPKSPQPCTWSAPSSQLTSCRVGSVRAGPGRAGARHPTRFAAAPVRFPPLPLLFSSPPLPRPPPTPSSRVQTQKERETEERRSSVATPKSSDLIESPRPNSLNPNPSPSIGRPAHAKVRFFFCLPPLLLEPRAACPRTGLGASA